MLAAIDAAAADRDTLGGIIEIRAFGSPPASARTPSRACASTRALRRPR